MLAAAAVVFAQVPKTQPEPGAPGVPRLVELLGWVLMWGLIAAAIIGAGGLIVFGASRVVGGNVHGQVGAGRAVGSAVAIAAGLGLLVFAVNTAFGFGFSFS